MPSRNLTRRPDCLSGIFFFLVGLGIIIFSSIIQVGTFDNPGPGLFPLLSGIFLTGLSAVLVYRTRDKIEESIFDLSREGYARVFGLPLLLVFYAGVVDPLGFVITTCLLLLYFLKFISKYSWKRAILYGLVISVATYVVFNSFLEVGLPVGIIPAFK